VDSLAQYTHWNKSETFYIVSSMYFYDLVNINPSSMWCWSKRVLTYFVSEKTEKKTIFWSWGDFQRHLVSRYPNVLVSCNLFLRTKFSSKIFYFDRLKNNYLIPKLFNTSNSSFSWKLHYFTIIYQWFQRCHFWQHSVSSAEQQRGKKKKKAWVYRLLI
jgi:hypothetical protein